MLIFKVFYRLDSFSPMSKLTKKNFQWITSVGDVELRFKVRFFFFCLRPMWEKEKETTTTWISGSYWIIRWTRDIRCLYSLARFPIPSSPSFFQYFSLCLSHILILCAITRFSPICSCALTSSFTSLFFLSNFIDIETLKVKTGFQMKPPKSTAESFMQSIVQFHANRLWK